VSGESTTLLPGRIHCPPPWAALRIVPSKRLLEHFGGANGELAAAMQYSIQGINCEDAARKDLLMDIGTEELSHLEVIGTLARLHLKPSGASRTAAEADPLIAICGGGGVNLYNSQGDPWTADYLKVTGELDVELRSNIAAEARAKIVYEWLVNFTDDVGTKDALQFLMTREITHMKAFAAALESMGKDPSGSAAVGMMVVHRAVVSATLSCSNFTRSKSAVNILFDPIAKHVFEQLPSQRNRALDMNVAFVAPTSDLESGSDDSRRMVVVGPVYTIDPTEIARSGVLNCRLKVLLRSLRSHTVCNGDT
jgi:Mn-containing catalase